MLGSRRRAGSDTAENDKRNGNDDARGFQPVNRRRHLHDQRGSRDGGARGGADRTDMRIERTGVQIHTAMQLRREKYASDEESQAEKSL
jgi:hypothetical protein